MEPMVAQEHKPLESEAAERSGEDPLTIAVRCAPRLRSYLRSLIANWHDAEDLLQEFFVRGLERGFIRQQPARGKLESYLKAAVRNAAIDYLRCGQRRQPSRLDVALLPGKEESNYSEHLQRHERGREVLYRAWNRLERHESRSPGNYGHTLLAWSLQHPDLTSQDLAVRLSARFRRPITATAVRKQISRARQLFARFLIEALEQEKPLDDPEQLEGAVLDLGWMPFLRGYLSDA